MTEISPTQMTTILCQVETLSADYDYDELGSLLQAEQIRMRKGEGAALGLKDLGKFVKEIALKFGDEARQHEAFSSGVITLISLKVVDLLIANQVISPDSLELNSFIISIMTAMALKAIFNQWDERRD